MIPRRAALSASGAARGGNCGVVHASPAARARLVVPALVVAAALIAGCSSGGSSGGSDPSGRSGAAGGSSAPGSAGAQVADDPALAAYYKQKLDWGACPADTGSGGDGLRCAKLRVPLDYAAPNGKTVELAVYRKAAGTGGKAPLGVLAVNPGGPGSPVRGMVAEYADTELATMYDIVGFDPRGVGGSRHVDCGDGPLDRVQSIDPTPADAAAVQQAAAVLKEFGQGCATRMGDLLPTIGTDVAVRDMDVFRAALGADRLNYVGTSYGTYLGALYAERHPARTGRFVLDGLVDPAADRFAQARDQAAGFELAFRAFAEDCARSADCVLTRQGTGYDAMSRSLRAQLDRISDAPLRVGARVVDEAMVSAVICSALYSPGSWSQLRMLLQALYAGDGRTLLRAFDAYADRRTDGTYDDPTLPPYFEVSCADGRTLTAAEADRLARDVAATMPVLAPSVVWSWAADCPAPGRDRARPLDGANLPGMLLVSTTRDPATPHSAAVGVKAQLPASKLLTYEGDGHVAIGRGAPCVDTTVRGFLTTGKLPQSDVTC